MENIVRDTISIYKQHIVSEFNTIFRQFMLKLAQCYGKFLPDIDQACKILLALMQANETMLITKYYNTLAPVMTGRDGTPVNREIFVMQILPNIALLANFSISRFWNKTTEVDKVTLYKYITELYRMSREHSKIDDKTLTDYANNILTSPH